MHGREGENRIRSRHMWSVPTRGTTVRRTKSSTADSFCKGGRKISVGDCALFEPAQDSPPFIGLIPWLALNKDNNLQLGVNWLYRPGDLKLCKGVLLDAAPNEVFYSFHKNEIPAASLLHPCKVAFLPKGVELPSGISSFVCRRVYDVANKCLWWLTDQDFIDERQQEVDKLLYKTRLQMYPTVQPGGRSPKPLHVPTSTSQLKPGANNIPGSGSFPSQAKGKKRERADQDNVPVKRERSSMTDNGTPVQFKPENNLKYGISKITEKGGLVDPEGVEKLVQLMQPDKAERRMELISRSMLAGVIAATEKFDCLSRFVQLKGLLVLDEWLQDAHKGKIGDGSPKEGDKSLEDFLLVLLRALDKLPVNLHALQMCNIGKSVNHLRSHKNMEIQKKARSLVDMWKKRVEAEMNVIEAKPGSAQAVSWPSKSHLPEISHGRNQHPGGFSEAAMKSAVTQLSASKNASVKPASEITAKSTSSSPGTTKSAVSPGSGKDSHPRIVVGNTSDLPSTTAREERSSSSSQSHNNGQSCSSDLAKTTVFSGKEDPKSSTAGSINVSKMSGSSRHRRSMNGFSGPAVSGGNRETGSSRSSSVHRNSASEKLSPSGLTCEKDLDVPIVEGNSHKLIVKIPTRGRSPAQSASGGSVDGHSNINSRASSPVLSEKHDQSDRNSKVKIDANRADPTYDVKTESWQSNDFKDVLTGSDEGDGSPAAIPEEERCRPGDDAAKLAEISRAASSSSGDELKSGKLHGASFSSINALIDSCVKYTEANASMSVGDDVGMNLLATVAAGEISRSDTISQTDSPRGNTPSVEDSIVGNDAKSKSFHGNNLPQEQSQSVDGAVDIEKQTAIAGASWSRDELYHLSKQTSGSISGEGNEYHSCNLDFQPSAEPCLEVNGRSNVLGDTASVAASPAIATDKLVDGEKSKQHTEKAASVTTASIDDIQDTKPKESCSLLTDDKVCEVLPSELEKEVVEGSLPQASLETSNENKVNGNEGCDGDHTERKPPPGPTQSENLEANDEGLLNNSCSSKDLTSENADVDGGKAGKTDTRNQGGKRKFDYGANSTPSNEKQVLVGLAVRDEKSLGMEANGESKDVLDHCSGGAVTQKESPLHAQELEQHMISRGPKMTDAEADETEERASTAADASSSPAQAPNTDTKLKFDLNEGFAADEGKCGEPLNFVGPGSSASVHLVNRLPYRVPSVSSGFPASITVAAAAKRPFVPPEDLLRSKGELGWKGSAATSAFRPAEPRKFLEMPLGTTNMPLPDTTANKLPRPLLDIDLNVPDERILEDMASRNFAQETASTSEHTSNRDLARNGPMGSAPVSSSRGLVLDLNLVDEASDMGQHSTSISRRLEAPFLPVKMSSTGGFPNSEVRRDFDLNDGPVLDEAVAEPLLFSQHVRSSMQSHPPVAGLRMNNAEMAWFPTGNTYSALTVPSILADRGEHPFPVVASGGLPRMSGPSTSGTSFTPDVFRGSMLSSPAMPFPSTPFQYPVFPFGNSFPMPSAAFSGGSTSFMDSSSGGRLSFPAISSQLLGPASRLSSQYPRPYVVSLPDGSSNIVDNSRKWGRQGLDLNAGPGNLDMEGRDETSPLASRHLSVVNSQVLAEEQARMYQQMAGSILKRKEPEGGWDAESYRHKQSSWQ